MLGLAIILYYVPEILVRGVFDHQLKTEEETYQSLLSETQKIEEEIGKKTNTKSQLEAYNKQVEKLKARSAQVDEILKIRTNPKKILEKMARSIPEDLWIDNLKINEKSEVTISGGADSPRSIGEFITIINDSPFFGNSITPVKQENRSENLDGVPTNVEVFELKGKIKNYDMRSR
jgi:Tfp pilus assembly protein PilN